MSQIPVPAVPTHAALQLIGVPACAVDGEGRVLAASPELEALLGFTPGGAELWARHAQADSAAQLEAAMATGAARSWDSFLARADGQYVAVRVALKPHGAGATLVFQDVSQFHREQRQARKALLEQQAILENAAVGIIFGKAGYVQECNIRAAEMFGYDRHELEGRPGTVLYPTVDDHVDLIAAARPSLEQGLSFRTETRLRRKDGALFWARVYGRALDPSDVTSGTVWIVEDISEQRAADESMRQLLLEQGAILDNASDAILFTKAKRMLSCNPRMADMFGYGREELYGRPAVDLFPSPQAYEAFGKEAGPLLGSGQPFEMREFQLKRKDGSLFWCRVRAKAISEERDGGTIWIMEDITQSRQTQMEVEALMTNASISILFTKNRVITRYNRGFADMFGYEGDEGLGMPGMSLYPSRDAYERLGASAAPLLMVGKPFQTEVEMRRKDDTTFWAQLIAYVVNPNDPGQGTIWIVEDRTEQKLAEESLRNALLENQAILDSAVLGISVCENGHNLRCNAKMEELFGYAPGEMDSLSVRAFYADHASWDLARQETARDFAAGRVNMSEHELVRKDGSRFWARLSGRPFDLAQPKGRSVWLVDDITARREDAEAVRRARDELEVRVLERTAELAGANALLQGEIVERRQAEARVHHMAYHDSLTGLPNRALLADRLDRAMLAAQRSERRLAVMFIDLDRFKTINDSLGHMTGDQLLKEVASRLCRAVRASDTVARLGGDEFVVLVPGIRSVDEASRVAEKIIEALAAPFPLEGRMLHITPSIGICVYPDDGADVETLMRHADGAMYHAKAAGRNNYQFFTQKMNLAAAQHFELESSLRGALALGQFEPHFQPIIDITTRRVHTMEVLLRWRRPSQGLVMPDSFIPLLEENGLIVPIGEWVMRRACEQSMEWLRMGLEPVPLAVNLSPRQFMHRGLVESIQRILDETGIDPSMIEFEITETALMQHGEHTMEILGRINAMGIRLSIDDFGTGYSSLAYLKRFPVKKIKIDRAFIKELEESAEDRAIVAAIIALSDSLQLSVVAEGVETEGQYALLRAQGCQYAQGYLFSQPVPRVNAQNLLERRAAA
ncbi:bifunctional diguanylate cyclase/phosphodiesterase [Pseudoduganella namucuonensis]|uniref:PAS domain S-box-containing protein/diguanylate cyclase (GGDEF) domain-containing protein n=1 Tax=Pseudoduganella namucuonensis TaxID=1035707 RepID=A0A1I7LYI2_9BURK|nr:EAL domain-containing protein [Pseudoduganella namucuonensis]SFV14719.1 PAS domain S-box-containing protein/diguanylate cyclase (GGDEF) domain-containing protein [Pseudoduganella namucuonensis]